MYFCNKCKKEFHNPKKEREVIGVSDKTETIEYEYCPYCDSDDFNKIHHFYCLECEYMWDSIEEYSIQSGCPMCNCGDIKEDDEDE